MALFEMNKDAILKGYIAKDIDSYIFYYKNSANLLLNLLISYNIDEDIKKINDTHIVNCFDDNYIIPNNNHIIVVVYLYRHSIELALKKILLILKTKECIKNCSTPNRDVFIKKTKTHSLVSLWKNEITPLLKIYWQIYNYKKKELSQIYDYLKEIDKYDDKSIAFRYPYSKKIIDNQFEKTLNDLYYINIENFKENINILFNLLEQITDYFQGEMELYDYILTITESMYYRNINNKKVNISIYDKKATINHINNLCMRHITVYSKYLNKRLIQNIFLLKDKTQEFFNKQDKKEDVTIVRKEILLIRKKIKYYCKKIIGKTENYF